MKAVVILSLTFYAIAFIPGQAAIINIPDDYLTIQEGIDVSTDGDTVLVADGTYTGDGNLDIDFGGKAIMVTSENGPEFTIIDCEGANYDEHRAFKFQSGEASESILEGFTIQSGYAPWDGPYGSRVGGTIYSTNSSSPTIIECILRENYAYDRGGAVYCDDNSSISFIDCVFEQNTANRGGGVASKDTYVSFTGCAFIANFGASSGGGIFCRDSTISTFLTLVECDFYENMAGEGGGLDNRCHKTSIIADCYFVGNTAAGRGGAIYSSYSPQEISDCIFENNSSGGRGGAVYLSNASSTVSSCEFYRNSGIGGGIFCVSNDAVITHCAFVENSGNSGGGMGCASNATPLIANCTFYGNSADNGAGVYCVSPSFPVLENCIIAFSDQGEAIYGSSPTLSCCDIYGNAGGDWVGYIAPQYGENGNFSEDPLFCDTSYSILTLTNNSPCAPENNSCGVLVGAYGVACSGMYNFSLISPPSDTIYLEMPSEFVWQSTTDVDSGFPASYKLYIDEDPLFGSPDSSEVLSDTTYSLSDTLARSASYYWRVLAFNDFGIPRFSAETWNFYMDGFPDTPEIIAPSDGAVVDSSTYFAWLVVTDPDSFDAVTYTIQVDDDTSFGSPEIDQSGLGSGLILDDAYAIRLGNLQGFENLIPGMVYFWRVKSDDNYGLSSAWTDGTNYFAFLLQTGTNSNVGQLPNEFLISQNYPNPFNAQTTVRYQLPYPSYVTIEVYNIVGRKVETLMDGQQPVGYHQITWDANDHSSGMYFYRIQAGEYTETKKMLLLK